MQYLRSKLFTVLWAAWTLILGLATPVLMIINRGSVTRSYARFWARGVVWGMKHIIGLKYRIIGALPDDGKPRIIVCNHQSAWETIIIAALIKDVSFVAKRELTRIPIFGWFMSNYPMILIDRGGGRATLVDMVRQAQDGVKGGRPILIFPEGTRIGVDETKPYHFGVAALYKELNVPVLVLAHNSGSFWNDKFSTRHAGTVTLKVIEEILPGMPQKEFLAHIETVINHEKELLRHEAGIDEKRWAAA
jgi:1-acyl-sn-glycerol-3-phosphate acyltransferase